MQKIKDFCALSTIRAVKASVVSSGSNCQEARMVGEAVEAFGAEVSTPPVVASFIIKETKCLNE